MHKRCLLFTLAVIVSAASPSFAWWEDGHIIVAKIAEKHLSKEAQTGIRELLDGPEGERAISDSRMCNWADLIRGSGQLNRKYPKNDTWHYINIELQQKRDDSWKADEKGNDVIGAIERFKKVLADTKADKQDRKEALLFLVHFVGDMHQPLHTGNREDDRGGNQQPIESIIVNGKAAKDNFGKPHNLHKVWDGHLVDAIRGGLTVNDFATRLNDEMTDDERDAWKKGTVTDWVWDSHQITLDRVYKFTDGTDLPARDKPAAALTEENYMKANEKFVRPQLKKGGIRLATVLNECFK